MNYQNLRCDTNHAQPDPGEVSQVEDVVELGRSRKHLLLRDLPHLPRHRDQQLHQVRHVVREPTVGVEVSLKVVPMRYFDSQL